MRNGSKALSHCCMPRTEANAVLEVRGLERLRVMNIGWWRLVTPKIHFGVLTVFDIRYLCTLTVEGRETGELAALAYGDKLSAYIPRP